MLQEREESTKSLIIDVAEELFGRQGIAGTSLRHILRESGQKNMSAITYHFGTKDDLVRSIIFDRWQAVDELVGRDLGLASGNPESVPFEQLVRIAVRPGFDLKNANGGRSYCLFVSALLSDADYKKYWFDLNTLGPNMKAVSKLMRQALGLSNRKFIFRTGILMHCFYSAASEHDMLKARKLNIFSDEEFFDEITSMLASAWAAADI